MTEKDMQMSKDSVDSNVRLICSDGEILVAKILFVCEEDEGVIYDLVSTNKELNYEKCDKQPSYWTNFREIVRVELVKSS